MAKSFVTVPSRQYTAGSRSVNIPNLSTDDNGIQITLTRESWPDTGSDIISGVIEGTNDSGSTWFGLAPFSYPDGDQINPRTQQPVTAEVFRVYWPERGGVPQRPQGVRATVANTVTINTAITVEGL